LRRPLELGQHTSIVYSERLTDPGVAASIGSVGDAYDNSMAEALINTYKHEPLRNQHAIPDGRRLGWLVHHERLHSALDHRSPAEYEDFKRDNIKILSTR
jgi:transposase InsO family protein